MRERKPTGDGEVSELEVDAEEPEDGEDDEADGDDGLLVGHGAEFLVLLATELLVDEELLGGGAVEDAEHAPGEDEEDERHCVRERERDHWAAWR